MKIAEFGRQEMTKQRIFPFIVNGKFWKELEVNEKAIREGHIVVTALTSNNDFYFSGVMPEITVKMRHVVFQLAEVTETINPYKANWFSGFWIVDDKLYIEDENLYTK